MIDEHIDYKAKADEVFKYYEEKIFERERDDIDRDSELVFSFSDWINSIDPDDILEIVEIDLEEPDDQEKAVEKLIKIMQEGVDAWLGDPIYNLKGALKC